MSVGTRNTLMQLGEEFRNETRFACQQITCCQNLRLIPVCKISCHIFTNICFWSHKSFEGRSNVTLKEIRVILKKVCVTLI